MADIQFDPQMMILLSAILKDTMPLNLSNDCSINISKVVRFEPVEKLDEKEKPTGELVPALIFDGGDVMFLTDDQIKIFRPIWDLHCKLSNDLFSMMHLYAYPNQNAPATATDQ